MLVRDRMTRDIVKATPRTTVAEALSLTRENAIRHLPVVENGRLVGLVTDRDLRLAMPAPWETDTSNEKRIELSERTVSELMIHEVMTVSPEMLMEDAARLFYENKIGCLPVMEGNELVGILTASDLLRAFVDIFTVHDNSTRIELRIANRPGELARVIRLIAVDYKLHVTGLIMEPDRSGEVMMTIHVQTDRPEPLLERLQKMGYDVASPQLA